MLSLLSLLFQCSVPDTEWCDVTSLYSIVGSIWSNKGLCHWFIIETRLWLVLVCGLLCFVMFAGQGPVVSESMCPTLEIGQRIFWRKINVHKSSQLVINGVYVFDVDGEVFVKRLVGLPVRSYIPFA